MRIFKKKWKTIWEGPLIFSPDGGDGHYVLEKEPKGTYRAYFSNDNLNVPIEISELCKMYTAVDDKIKYNIYGSYGGY